MPVDPTPEALARDPAVQEALALVYDLANHTALCICGPCLDAKKSLISTLLTVLRESEGPVLDFEVAEDAARRIERTDFFDWSTMSKPYEAALEAQAATRVAAFRAQMKELEQAAFPTGDASDRDTLKRVKGLLRPDRGANGERTDNSEAPR